MCGIAGLVQVDDHPVDGRVLEAMTSSLAHRGPDGEGYVLLAPGGEDKPIAITGRLSRSHRSVSHAYSVGFGHRRLAVLDPSPLGHQPMSNERGTIWIAYNGEIYNYLELRDELRLKGYRFRSNTDTEVLLAAYAEWGEACVRRFNGMFAFAIWDAARRRLFCARDRFGEKPFYYYWDRQQFAFASEIKGLLPACGRRGPNNRAILQYLEHAVLDGSEDTFFDGIYQLLPSHYLVVEGGKLTQTRYWALPDGVADEHCSQRDLIERFRDLFQDAIRLRLRSDVELGSCLSGGLDSSSIVCVASALRGSHGPLQTFSSCFNDPAYDERTYSEQVVSQTNAKPRFTFPDPKELPDVVAELVWHQDEPFGSTSIFAQWNVMRLARQHGVKVLLDGQGADEQLGGYHRYFGAFFADLLLAGRVNTFWKEVWAYRRLHKSFPKELVARCVRSLLPASLVRAARGWLTGSAHWLAPDFRRDWVSEPGEIVRPWSQAKRFEHELLTGNGLRALLHYEDRNSMAFGVEARLPFLDHRLVEFLYGLDTAHKVHMGWTKVILREAMKGVLPERVRCRLDKMGFVTPEDQWFQTSLSGLAREVLSDARTRERGYLNQKAALRNFESHVAGRITIGRTIWRWLNVELWCRQFVDRNPCGESLS